MNENETIATAVVADYEGKQGKAAMARHEKLGQIIEDAMYTLAHVSRQLAFGGELHKRNTFELKGLIARVRERVRQPAMACSCVGMLVLGMVMWNGKVETVFNKDPTDQRLISHAAKFLIQDGDEWQKKGDTRNAWHAYSKAVDEAKRHEQPDFLAIANDRLKKMLPQKVATHVPVS